MTPSQRQEIRAYLALLGVTQHSAEVALSLADKAGYHKALGALRVELVTLHTRHLNHRMNLAAQIEDLKGYLAEVTTKVEGTAFAIDAIDKTLLQQGGVQ